MTLQPHQVLKQYWGYDSFRPVQEDIIASVLAGKDTLALLPTGGGKSICFQVPALCMDGLCLVITPLVALMADQVQNLVRRGVEAVEIHSGMHPHEIRLAYDKCMEGRTRFLYLSPERLTTQSFRDFARSMKLCLIAVDEAHCISQWGYDFRPPYLQIEAIRQLFPGVPVLALTATAVDKVVDDIQSKLGFASPNVFRKSFKRDNLAYLVYKEEDKYRRLVKIANSISGTGIVYVRNRRLTREIAEYLNRNGIKANFYHAGLEPALRSSRQQEWMTGKARVMVSTNAFGMGIDKPDVRFVVHMDLPENLEAYFQEAGRAGRDEKNSYAILLYQESDLMDARHFVEMAWPDPPTIRQVYQALGNFFQLAVGSGREMAFDFDLELFASQYRLKPITVYNVLKILEREGYLALTDALDSPPRVMFQVGKEELYKFQVENREADHIIKVLLRSYSGLFMEFTSVNEYEIARRLQADTSYVHLMLINLAKTGILEYIPRKKSPQIIFTSERMAPENIELSKTFYFERKKDALYKVEQLIDYVSMESGCRSQALLKYFGDQTGKECGVCDLCHSRKKESTQEATFEGLRQHIMSLMGTGSKTTEELIQALPSIPEREVLGVLRWMVDSGLILTEDGKYFLK